MLLEKIEALRAQIKELKADNSEAIEALRIKYLSKKGEVTALFNEFRNVPNDQKREFGQRLNELKTLATEKINSLKEKIQANEAQANKIDITRPAFPSEIGTRHPISASHPHHLPGSRVSQRGHHCTCALFLPPD